MNVRDGHACERAIDQLNLSWSRLGDIANRLPKLRVIKSGFRVLDRNMPNAELNALRQLRKRHIEEKLVPVMPSNLQLELLDL